MKFLGLAALVVAPLAFADICDDVNEVANAWNDVANFVHQYGDEELPDDAYSELRDAVNELAEGTFVFAEALQEYGDDQEVQLGGQIHDAMGAVYNANGSDEAVYALDNLVEVIDRTTDYCDAQ